MLRASVVYVTFRSAKPLRTRKFGFDQPSCGDQRAVQTMPVDEPLINHTKEKGGRGQIKPLRPSMPLVVLSCGFLPGSRARHVTYYAPIRLPTRDSAGMVAMALCRLIWGIPAGE
jgi:hypothetical protein